MSNVRTAIDAAPPKRPDGREWRYSVVDFRAGQAVWADHLGDIVAVVIDGYDRVADDQDASLLARDASIRAQGRLLAANLLQQAVSAGQVEEEDLADEDWLNLVLGSIDTPPDLVSWGEDRVMLVLDALDFAPFTSRPAPSGNVAWLNPHNELTMMNSLAEYGLADFYINEFAD